MSGVRDDILQGLVVAFDDAITDDADYSAGIVKVIPYIENANTWQNTDTPLVMIVDIGEEKQTAEDPSNVQFEWMVQLRGLYISTTTEDLQEIIAKVVADIKRFLSSAPAITEIKEIRYLGTDTIYTDMDTLRAECVISAIVTYACARGTY